jgi:hypothetical protein
MCGLQQREILALLQSNGLMIAARQEFPLRGG